MFSSTAVFLRVSALSSLRFFFFFKQKTAYEIGLGIPAEPLFRSAGNSDVFFCVSKNVSVSCAYTQGKREQFSGFNRTLDAINNVFRKFKIGRASCRERV